MDEKATSEFKKLTHAINRSNNLWWAFFRGIFYGFGFFIGSAVLATIFIYIFSGLKSWAYIGDLIEQIINIASKTQS